MLNMARDHFGMEHWKRPEPENWKQVALERMGLIPDQCPVCKGGVLIVVTVIAPKRGPPLVDPRRYMLQ